MKLVVGYVRAGNEIRDRVQTVGQVGPRGGIDLRAADDGLRRHLFGINRQRRFWRLHRLPHLAEDELKVQHRGAARGDHFPPLQGCESVARHGDQAGPHRNPGGFKGAIEVRRQGKRIVPAFRFENHARAFHRAVVRIVNHAPHGAENGRAAGRGKHHREHQHELDKRFHIPPLCL